MYSAAIALLANFVKYKNFDQFSQNFCNRIIDRKIRLTDLTYWSTAKIRTPDISYHCENFSIQNKIDHSIRLTRSSKPTRTNIFFSNLLLETPTTTRTLKWQTSARNYGTASATKTLNSPPGSKPLLLVARKPSSAVSSPPPLFSSLPLV